MAMKNYVIIIFLLLFTQTSLAQSTNDAKSINAIKLDTTYLYGEATKAELSDALSDAKSRLEIEVSEWVNTQHSSEGIEVCIAKAKERCSEIQTKRGSLFRVFVYVKKSDILPVADKSEVVVIKVAKDNPQPKPVVERPLVVEQEITPEANPKSNEAEEKNVTKSQSKAKKIMPTKSRPDVKLTADERKMVAITNKKDLETYLKTIDGMGKIKKNGKLNNLPQNEKYHLFIYDRQDNVLTVLRKEGSVLINLKEKREDYVDNYDNCGFVWIQLR